MMIGPLTSDEWLQVADQLAVIANRVARSNSMLAADIRRNAQACEKSGQLAWLCERRQSRT
jgi:hypothetical protein